MRPIIQDVVSQWARPTWACAEAVIPGAQELSADFKDPLGTFFQAEAVEKKFWLH